MKYSILGWFEPFIVLIPTIFFMGLTIDIKRLTIVLIALTTATILLFYRSNMIVSEIKRKRTYVVILDQRKKLDKTGILQMDYLFFNCSSLRHQTYF